MLPPRKETELLEQVWLEPYAAKSVESFGRKYAEQSHECRAEFQSVGKLCIKTSIHVKNDGRNARLTRNAFIITL